MPLEAAAGVPNHRLLVHTTRGEEIRVEHSVIEGIPLVTMYGSMFPEGLVDLDPEASKVLGSALITRAALAAVSSVEHDTGHLVKEDQHDGSKHPAPIPQIAGL